MDIILIIFLIVGVNAFAWWLVKEDKL